MKKLLALVLALVMTLGLATVGTSAAYSDADSINYKEAVDVMSSIGVLAGDENGFRPTDTLKRSEGAKIIAYLILGNKTAEAIQATGNKFTDVAAKDWFAGYVEYLASIGVIGGVGGGKFDPNGTLTTTQFAKMLLTALGYDAKIENLVGNDWAINTQKLANQAKLFDGNKNVVGTAAITREEAALYALNTLKAPLVEYESKGTTINVGDTAITTSASNAKYVTSTIAKEQTISNTKLSNSNDYTVEFAEKYYTDLKLASNGTDDFENPAKVWTNKGVEIGTYAKEPDLTYTVKAKYDTIYKDLNLTKGVAKANITYYVDGALQAAPANDLVKGDTTNFFGEQGVLTNVYYDSDDNTMIVTETHFWVGKITAVYAKTSTKDAYVTFEAKNDGAGTKFDTDDAYAVNDYVIYTYSKKTGENCVESMAKAEKVSGTLNGYTANKGVQVDSTTYPANYTTKNTTNITSTLTNAVNTAVDVYLDSYGNAIWVDAKAASDAYAVVLGYDEVGVGNAATTRANLLFFDGTTATVTVKAGAGTTAYHLNNDDAISPSDIVRYSINGKKEYTLTLVADAKRDYTGVTLITNGTAALNGGNNVKYGYLGTNGSVVSTKKADTPKNANGSTVFLFYNSVSKTINRYVGIANVPTFAVAAGKNATMTAFSTTQAGALKLVYGVYDGTNQTLTNVSKDVVFIKGNSDGVTYTDATGSYYEYDAIVNGEIGKIRTDKQVQYKTIAVNASKDSDDIYTIPGTTYTADDSGSNAKGDSNKLVFTTKTDKVSNGTVTFGDVPVSIASDAKVFRIATDGTISQETLGSIGKDTNDKVWYKITDGEITTVVIETVDDLSTVTVVSSDIKTIKRDLANDYKNTTFYVADGRTLTAAEMRAALLAQVKADGNTAISVSGTTLNFTDSTGVAHTTLNITQTQVYKVTNLDNSTVYYVDDGTQYNTAAVGTLAGKYVKVTKDSDSTVSFATNGTTGTPAYDVTVAGGYYELTVANNAGTSANLNGVVISKLAVTTTVATNTTADPKYYVKAGDTLTGTIAIGTAGTTSGDVKGKITVTTGTGTITTTPNLTSAPANIITGAASAIDAGKDSITITIATVSTDIELTLTLS